MIIARGRFFLLGSWLLIAAFAVGCSGSSGGSGCGGGGAATNDAATPALVPQCGAGTHQVGDRCEANPQTAKPQTTQPQ